MNTYVLYSASVLVWGSTWIMMKYQLGVVDPSASLTYRYGAAGLLVLACAVLFGRSIRLTRTQHLACAVQGALMFSINYWLTYLAAQHLTTGIVSVFFAGTAATTMALSALVMGSRPSPRAVFGAVLGVAGIALVFWPEIEAVDAGGPELAAGGYVLISVLMFSAGGVLGARTLGHGTPRFAVIGWSMLYGSGVMAALVLLRGERFGFDPSFAYIGSLIWLVVLGSGLVFALYFTVVERIGAEKASYATVLFPLVALVISTFAEDYRWPLAALAGVPLALVGNALVLAQATRSPSSGQSGKGKTHAFKGHINIVEIPDPDIRR